MPDPHVILTVIFLGLGGFAYLTFLAGARRALVEKAKAEAEAEEKARQEAEEMAAYDDGTGIPEVGSV